MNKWMDGESKKRKGGRRDEGLPQENVYCHSGPSLSPFLCLLFLFLSLPQYSLSFSLMCGRSHGLQMSQRSSPCARQLFCGAGGLIQAFLTHTHTHTHSHTHTHTPHTTHHTHTCRVQAVILLTSSRERL